jgi:hypothetical protein
MENQIVCPHCKKTIANNSIIDDAAKGEGSDTQSMVCDCGEKITYWQITAQLRDQKTISRRFQKWVQTLSHSRA